VLVAADVASALGTVRDEGADCLILGPQASGEAVAGPVATEGFAEAAFGRLPVVVYDPRGKDSDDELGKRLGEEFTVRHAHSPERLFDLTTFFLHQSLVKLPEKRRQQLLDLHHSDKLLSGRKVLIVDDDMRNIFTLSAVLEEHDMVIVSSDNGREAIRILENDPNIDIVLMDIMMPEMDGMETMREIRKITRLKNLPIIAVTAKAMKGDREKCIEAGAWDYLSKPVDTEQMLAALRAWLHR